MAVDIILWLIINLQGICQVCLPAPSFPTDCRCRLLERKSQGRRCQDDAGRGCTRPDLHPPTQVMCISGQKYIEVHLVSGQEGRSPVLQCSSQSVVKSTTLAKSGVRVLVPFFVAEF